MKIAKALSKNYLCEKTFTKIYNSIGKYFIKRTYRAKLRVVQKNIIVVIYVDIFKETIPVVAVAISSVDDRRKIENLK